ncbi:siderophore-interacting protein [Nocardioides sp. MAH-18]|uniref:Siderophore-interacting protein n=1 Tax=Nocardioides agri TaxID=2682843 RepID=A0A6L6XS74_9ACTN|nr:MULTISPECIES: siderophore-interacting protein [unclassified Nocardioides]MBA2954778.1 siderophore-interacting protein [Nocardioides sp. CGMCC 1.13656]MVQ49633.1 siderophore-interacting protein [Nocardioides sp. MAH-18]
MTVTAPQSLPMILDEVEVVGVDRLSPSFVRVELGGACLADFGVEGPLYDQRIKLVFPGVPGGPLPSFAGADDSWWTTWLSRPEEERGHMRTYTVRDVVGSGVDTRLVVDIVVHGDAHGTPGPGCAWAARAQVGDRVVLMAPRRGIRYGGIEFVPPAATGRLLLVGDETAVPAVCAILAQLPADAVGAAFLEVPTAADVLPVVHPEGVSVSWHPREGADHGAALHPAVLAHLGVRAAPLEEPAEVDPDLWETPTYSSSGEAIDGSAADGDELYAWIAGESAVVTALRRVLVKDLGVDRTQVAFMGYWRKGVAMRS